MKKLITTAGILLCFVSAFAGGILTNGNQSAQYIRMLSRNASTGYDAVYFNPAGLTKMENGLFIAVQNQMLIQTKTIISGYPLLNTSTYEGEIRVPVFPTAYAIYKMDRFAFSFGFSPNSGGGSAEFNKGLPSFEKDISKLVPGLAGLTKVGQSITGYKTDISFEGKSVFWGIQVGASYKINEVFSVYGGARYVPAQNKYSGFIKNIEVKANGQFKNASNYLTGEMAPLLTGLATQSTGAASSVQPLITAGAGSLTLAQVQGAGYISAAQRAQLEGGLLNMGLTQAQINAMPLSTVQSSYTASAATLTTQAATMSATGAALKDKLVDVKQTGSGVTPIIGANISPVKGLNIGLKYEFKTKLTLTNNTTVDGTGKFPDKQENSSDIPALFSIGADYKASKNFNFSVSYNNYNDMSVNWGKNTYGQERTIDHNGWELAVGGQYQVCNHFAVSMGYLRTAMGVSKQFNSDFSFYSVSNTFGGGFEIKPTANLTIDLGALVTKYDNAPKSFTDPSVGNYTETYKKHNLGFAIGLGYRFGTL
jgi:long-subunit fatty acid transport protein